MPRLSSGRWSGRRDENDFRAFTRFLRNTLGVGLCPRLAGENPDRNKFAPTFVGALERETGFEPAISALARQRSTSEPLPHIKLLVRIKGLEPPRRRH